MDKKKVPDDAPPESTQMPAAKLIIVTGAGSGIGRATALKFNANGWRVVLVGRRADRLDVVAKESYDLGRAFCCPTDVSDQKAVKRLFETVHDQFGRIDVLFNNAGIGNPKGELDDWTSETWGHTIGTNLNGAFFCMQQAFSYMRRQLPSGGRIINSGSISAHSPRPNSWAYSASKHGLSGLTKAAALDGRRWNIAVGQIDMGNAASEMSAALMKSGVPQADGSLAQEPVMSPECVAEAVWHMANLPNEVNFYNVILAPTAMPYVGRG